MGEFEAIQRIAARFSAAPPGEVWIGDDCAVLAGGLLVAADVVVEGVHFEPSAPLTDVGWKAVAVNVSDVAAMGGRPTHLVVTVAAPPATDLDALYDGIEACATEFACPVVGGDLSGGPVMAVSVTVLGTTDGRPPVLRAGARPGDGIWVTGALGGGAASGYRRRPTPRVEQGVAAATAGATAMIDVSDGLGADLGHVLEASGVGAELVEGAVPLAAGATLEQAMGGGDDYELVFTGPDGAGAAAGATRIGTIVADRRVRPPASGWQHRFA
ncbi:MAG TPA: thiamine-phosphate kinase [Acidimicrobiales bacterium]|nr:thiamine-phosphate kinase [Acidimicrobiales bacterium]